MTSLDPASIPAIAIPEKGDGLLDRILASRRVLIGGGLLLAMIALCVITLPFTLNAPDGALYFDYQNPDEARQSPSPFSVPQWFGTDNLGRSLLERCLLGGTLSLGIGILAALISVLLGVFVGLLAGYRGGKTDAFLMRFVDVLYGLPYILLVILLQIAFGGGRVRGIIVLFCAIGLVSWLTMARVVRGQVLSLRSQPFIEACRASGLTEWRIFTRHLLPNLVGPIIVYATLIIPQAILQESFLSFLGIGIQDPLPTWGSLASNGLLLALNPVQSNWWLLLFPCTLLAITLLSLNFLGDGLRDVLDPRREQAKI